MKPTCYHPDQAARIDLRSLGAPKDHQHSGAGAQGRVGALDEGFCIVPFPNACNTNTDRASEYVSPKKGNALSAIIARVRSATRQAAFKFVPGRTTANLCLPNLVTTSISRTAAKRVWPDANLGRRKPLSRRSGRRRSRGKFRQ